VEALEELEIREKRKRAQRRIPRRRREEVSLYPSHDEWPDEIDVDQVFIMSSQRKINSSSRSIRSVREEERWVFPPIDPVIPNASFSDLMYTSTVIEPPTSFSASCIAIEHEGEDDSAHEDVSRIEETEDDDITEPQNEDDDDDDPRSQDEKEKPTYKRPFIEVMPGIFCALRGSEETWQALLDGSTQHTKCASCSLSLECINAVSMVLCPTCRMITPLEGGDGGLGLGVEAPSDKASGAEHQSRVRVTRTFPMQVPA
jgi:hypothetical protein